MNVSWGKTSEPLQLGDKLIIALNTVQNDLHRNDMFAVPSVSWKLLFTFYNDHFRGQQTWDYMNANQQQFMRVHQFVLQKLFPGNKDKNSF